MCGDAVGRFRRPGVGSRQAREGQFGVLSGQGQLTECVVQRAAGEEAFDGLVRRSGP